jgi:hypothetical protein
MCLKAVFHPLLEYKFKELPSFARVFARYDIALCQSLHLSHTQITKVSYRRWNNDKRASIGWLVHANIYSEILLVKYATTRPRVIAKCY